MPRIKGVQYVVFTLAGQRPLDSDLTLRSEVTRDDEERRVCKRKDNNRKENPLPSVLHVDPSSEVLPDRQRTRRCNSQLQPAPCGPPSPQRGLAAFSRAEQPDNVG